MSDGNNSRATIIVTIVTVVGGIITAVITNWKSAPAAESQAPATYETESPKVRTDGLYFSEVKDSSVEYVRFYDDGSVASGVSNLQENLLNQSEILDAFEQADKAFERKKNYSITQDTMKFTMVEGAGSIIRCAGILDEFNILHLRQINIDGEEKLVELSFTPVKAAALESAQ